MKVTHKNEYTVKKYTGNGVVGKISWDLLVNLLALSYSKLMLKMDKKPKINGLWY